MFTVLKKRLKIKNIKATLQFGMYSQIKDVRVSESDQFCLLLTSHVKEFTNQYGNSDR